MPHVRANGIDIAYTTEGAGRRCCCCTARHQWQPRTGPPSDRSSGRRSSSTWSTRAATATPAGTRPTASTATCWSDDLLAFADALDLATFHVAAFSMGAMTALVFATRHPERLRTAIISGIDVLREPRTQGCGAAHGPGADRARGAGLGCGPGTAARTHPGSRRVEDVAHRDRAGRRRATAADARGAAAGPAA